MSINYTEMIKEPLNDMIDAFNDTRFKVYVGAVNPGKITYPAIHIIPDQVRHEDHEEFQGFFDLYFYYEKNMDRAEHFNNMIDESSSFIENIFITLYIIIEININF